MRPSPSSSPGNADLGPLVSESERPAKTSSALGPRLISAAVLAPLVLGAVYYGGWVYTALIGLVVLILGSEWRRMVGMRLPWLALGMVYIALSCWALWRLRVDPEWGRVTLFWLLAVVWGADTGGYIFGRALGGPKLAVAISPNKTWSGFLGGTATSALCGWGVVYLVSDTQILNIGWPFAALSAAIAVVSQIGDLFESWIKRRFGVKDSGAIIPGHGGLFDRVDGLVAAALAVVIISISVRGNVLAWLS